MRPAVNPLIWIAYLTVLEFALQATGMPLSMGVWDPLHPSTVIAAASAALIAVPLFAASLCSAARGWNCSPFGVSLFPWLAGAGCLLTGWLAGTFWPNSGDEHSYTFLADTLLAGRLSNPPPPDPELFKLFRVFTIDGKTFSQYPPGWPLVLAPFRALGLDWLANPLLTVVMGLSLLGAMRRLGVMQGVQAPALLIVLASPFVLFNGASLFSHTVCAAAACAIVWRQLADENRPSLRRKAVIGALFGVLLLARYEAFAIFACLYAADRLWYLRWRAFAAALPVLAGFLPFCAFHFAYNRAITGDAFLTPAGLATPDVTFGEAFAGVADMVARAGWHMLFWVAVLGLYGGFVLAALQVPAIVAKFKSRTLRFFDLALPATILFFLYLPGEGGHQYGARYWFFAWPLAILTIVSGLVAADGTFRLWGRRYALGGLAAAVLAGSAVSMPWLIVTARAYIDARREIYAAAPPVAPAIVLVPDRVLRPWPWPWYGAVAYALDSARNDIDFSGPVLYGLADAPDAVARACRLGGRAVFHWRAPGGLERMGCPGEPVAGKGE